MTSERYYTTRQVMDLLGIKSRQTLYNRGATNRAVRLVEGGPLAWPESVVRDLAAEQGRRW